MKLGLNFLSEDEKHRIHKDSIIILSQVGVKFMSNKALKILEKNGASVDYDTRIAKIPEEMVTEALKCAPKSFVLEQIVVDHEIARMCKRFKDGIDVSDAKDYMHDIEQVGPGGHFLAQPSTIKACRSDEFYLPELSDRNTFEHWQTLGSPTMYGNARNRVAEILAGPQKNPLSDDVLGKLEDIVRKANKELPSET